MNNPRKKSFTFEKSKPIGTTVFNPYHRNLKHFSTAYCAELDRQVYLPIYQELQSLMGKVSPDYTNLIKDIQLLREQGSLHPVIDACLVVAVKNSESKDKNLQKITKKIQKTLTNLASKPDASPAVLYANALIKMSVEHNEEEWKENVCKAMDGGVLLADADMESLENYSNSIGLTKEKLAEYKLTNMVDEPKKDKEGNQEQSIREIDKFMLDFKDPNKIHNDLDSFQNSDNLIVQYYMGLANKEGENYFDNLLKAETKDQGLMYLTKAFIYNFDKSSQGENKALAIRYFRAAAKLGYGKFAHEQMGHIWKNAGFTGQAISEFKKAQEFGNKNLENVLKELEPNKLSNQN